MEAKAWIIQIPTKSSPQYSLIKQACEKQFNVPSQNVLIQKMAKASGQYWSNVALKVNVKLGGINQYAGNANGWLPGKSEPPTVTPQGPELSYCAFLCRIRHHAYHSLWCRVSIQGHLDFYAMTDTLLSQRYSPWSRLLTSLDRWRCSVVRQIRYTILDRGKSSEFARGDCK